MAYPASLEQSLADAVMAAAARDRQTLSDGTVVTFTNDTFGTAQMTVTQNAGLQPN